MHPNQINYPTQIVLHETATGKILRTFEGHEAVVGWLAFSVEGRRLASSSWDGTVRVWDIDGKEKPVTLRHEGGMVHNVAFSPKENWLYSTWGNSLSVRDETKRLGGVSKWDWKTGKEHRSRAKPGAFPASLAVVAGGETIVTGDLYAGFLDLWNAATLEEVEKPFHPGKKTSTEITSPVGAACVSANDRWLATGSDDHTVRLWDRKKGEIVATLKGHVGKVTHLAFTDNDQVLTSIAWKPHQKTVQAEVIRWDLLSYKQINTFLLPPQRLPVARINPLALVTFFPDGKTIATVDKDMRSIALWNAARGGLEAVLPNVFLGKGSFKVLAVSPDGRQLAAAAGETQDQASSSYEVLRVYLWDVSSRRVTQSWTLRSAKNKLPGGEGIYSMAFCPAAQALALGGSQGDVSIWHIATQRQMLTLPLFNQRAAVTSLLFSPDGKTLAVGTIRGTGSLVLYQASPVNRAIPPQLNPFYYTPWELATARKGSVATEKK